MIYLSHTIGNNTPIYGGVNDVVIRKLSSVNDGNTANTTHLSFPNHIGTHIDVPKHFFNEGKRLTDYDASYWLFLKPQLINIKCIEGQLIKPRDIINKIKDNIDILLIRTGFEKYRSEKKYWSKNPGLSVDLAKTLRSNFPFLRAVGMDFISVTSRLHREEGRKAHCEFLGNDYKSEPIILVEDMSLVNYTKNINTIIVSPLMIEDADGAPCTVLAGK